MITTKELREKWQIKDRTAINDGWAPIVDAILERFKQNGDDAAVATFSCKQKFAQLRIDYNVKLSSDSVEFLQIACYQASQTCEFCGKQGIKQVIGGAWIAICCNPCLKNEERRRGIVKYY